MKTLTIQPQATEVNALLEQARNEDLLVRAPNGTLFMVTLIDDFDIEIARTRKNAKLMTLLDEWAKEPATISLDELKRELVVD